VSLYFAFPDGVYNYVCAECTALCCKGHGFGGSLEQQLRPLYVLYPQIESLVVSRAGDFVTLATTADGCVLLDADNRCRIEKEHHKSMKPTVCNTFPFNVFRRIGKTVTISPHFLCPLRLVVPAQPEDVEGSHAKLETDLRDVLTPEFVKTKAGPLALNDEVDAVATIEREKNFRDLCSRSLRRQNFRDTLREASADIVAFDLFAERAARLMRIDVPPRSQPYDELDDLLLAIAPVHRLALLIMSSEGILRALAIAELVVRRAWSLATLPLNLQGAMNLIASFAATERLLGQGDEALQRGIKSSKKDLTFQDPEMTFAAFIFLRDVMAGRGVMQTLEEAIPAEMPASDRSALFQKLGGLLDTGPSKSRGRKRSQSS
jgi:Fe-S-cluster containining protein